MRRQPTEGSQSISPLLIADRVYASNERGEPIVFQASPDRIESLAKNRLRDSSFATPIYADRDLILRHASMVSGKRQEHLYSIGK